jgi:hypothetical protein
MPHFTCECCDRTYPASEVAKGFEFVKICVRCDDELSRAEKAHQPNG